jgi:hypothetical protein
MNPTGGSIPEQQGYGAPQRVEPNQLEYSGQENPLVTQENPANATEYIQPYQEYPQQQFEAPTMNTEGTYGPQEAPQEPQYYPQGYQEAPQEFVQAETYPVTPDGQEIVTPQGFPEPQPMYHFPQQEQQPQPGVQTYEMPQNQPQQMAPERYQLPQQELYTQQAPEFVRTSATPELQTQLSSQRSKEGELVFVNPNLDPSQGQQSSSTQVTTQQVTAKIGGYPVSHTVTSNPQAALIQQIVQSGDPQSAGTWHAAMVHKIVLALIRMIPGN